jgi:nucleotide-binding universal stress UspA family protein
MKKILVPTDFSEVSRNAANYALHLAKTFGKELMLLHCNSEKENNSFNQLKEMAEIVSASHPLVKTNYMVSSENFNSKTVNKIINSENVRLIVMGSAGGGNANVKKIAGSTSINIIENAFCPVMVVPLEHKFTGINKIAYASDLSNIDNEMEQIVAFARKFNAKIDIFHVSPVFPDLADSEKINVYDKLEEVKQKHHYMTVSFFKEKMPHDNQVDKGIDLFLEESSADLLVIFHNSRSTFDQLFSSSHIDHSLTHLSTPLMVFPKGSV